MSFRMSMLKLCLAMMILHAQSAKASSEGPVPFSSVTVGKRIEKQLGGKLKIRKDAGNTVALFRFQVNGKGKIMNVIPMAQDYPDWRQRTKLSNKDMESLERKIASEMQKMPNIVLERDYSEAVNKLGYSPVSSSFLQKFQAQCRLGKHLTMTVYAGCNHYGNQSFPQASAWYAKSIGRDPIDRTPFRVDRSMYGDKPTPKIE